MAILLRRAQCAFTLIELMVVLVVLAVLGAIVVPNYMSRVDEAREVALRHNLRGLRTSIDQFFQDKGRYPDSLNELVHVRYIRAVPQDPMTQRADTWVLVSPPPAAGAAAGKVFDVKSGASGKASDGSAFADW